MRRAGAVVAIEGAAAIVVALILGVLGFAGGDKRVAFGTALWFVLVGVAVLAAGWALWTGRRWGRGIAVFAQLLLLPIAWYMAVGSHRPEYGIPVGVVALIALVLLFSPSTLRWWTHTGGQERSDPGSHTGYERASSESADPDTR